MNATSVWDFFLKFIWPLVMAYALFLHHQLSGINAKYEQLKDAHHLHVAQVNKDFATRETVAELENKLTVVLNRIDDKVTRILEQERR